MACLYNPYALMWPQAPPKPRPFGHGCAVSTVFGLQSIILDCCAQRIPPKQLALEGEGPPLPSQATTQCGIITEINKFTDLCSTMMHLPLV